MFGESYPEAADHLRAATTAHERLAGLWAFYSEQGVAEQHVTTAPDGSGRILITECWPDCARETLTAAFREVVNELWAVFDTLVMETAARLSVLQRLSEPDRPRFFPIADTEDGYDALLKEACLDGILRSQQRMITDCQPFRAPSPIPAAQRVREGLALLLDWSCRLWDGALVGAWVTPIEPHVEATPPHQIVEFDIGAPGPLTEETVVARFRVTGGSGGDVAGRAGSFLDLARSVGFVPADAEDTLDRRVKSAIFATRLFALSFANCMAEVGPVGRVLGREQSPDDLWTSIEDPASAWSDEVLDALRASELGIGLVRGHDELTFLVSTEDGVFERKIPAASPLNPNVRSGIAAEMATHNAAATWGLPDFVLLPKAEHSRNRNREIGDGLLVAGERGVVVQVKNREAVTDDSAKEASWIGKKASEAARQIHGTIRRLLAGPVEMTNGRNRAVHLDGTAVAWVGVVIIDHPDPPAVTLNDHRKGTTGVVTLLRRDWDFLFNQLRSTRQVIDYLHRVGGPSPKLGGEPERYFELAVADHEAAPEPPNPSLDGKYRSAPQLPLAPAGHENDQAHGVVRMMLEDIANSPSDDEEHERIALLAAIDRLLVAHRTDLGQLLLDELLVSRDEEDEIVRWRFRSYRFGLAVPQLGFGVCSQFNETIRDAFRTWVLLRHHERGTLAELEDAVTVGVLLTPRADGLREWDTTLLAIRGDPYLDDDDVDRLRRLWNTDGLDVTHAEDQRTEASPED